MEAFQIQKKYDIYRQLNMVFFSLKNQFLVEMKSCLILYLC